ncbi:MAG: c-type cytochrome [Bryobacteraceae bacterium]
MRTLFALTSKWGGLSSPRRTLVPLTARAGFRAGTRKHAPLWIAALFAGILPAQTTGGAGIFAQSCAVGYCHGSGGSAGRAPKLAGRGFDRAYLTKVVLSGVPGTGMPGFQGRLNEAEIKSVLEYVISLSGGAAPEARPGDPPKLADLPDAGSSAVRRGRDLFFDAVRGTRCSTCHAVEGRGIAIGPNVGVLARASAAGIRNAPAPNVKTAEAGGGRFPALVVEQGKETTRLYDLTTAPPVLRTLDSAQLKIGETAGWRHASHISSYSNAELTAVAEYVRWLSAR